MCSLSLGMYPTHSFQIPLWMTRPLKLDDIDDDNDDDAGVMVVMRMMPMMMIIVICISLKIDKQVESRDQG